MAVQKSLDEIYSSDVKEYYSGNNVDVFFNNIYVDECSGLGFRSVINSAPTFSYNSELFNSIAKGNFRVEGKFTVNFVANGYVERIIQKGEAAKRSGEFTPLGRLSAIETQLPTRANNGILNLGDPTFINTVIFDPQATALSEAEKTATKARLRDYIWGYLRMGEEAFVESLRDILVGTYFDILLMIGNPNTDTYDVKNIVDAQILDVSMELVKGMPLQLMYTFIARDIDRPSSRPNPFQFMQGSVPSAKGLNLTANKMLERIIDATKQYTQRNILDVHAQRRSAFGSDYDNSEQDLFNNISDPQPGINNNGNSGLYLKVVRSQNENSTVSLRDADAKLLDTIIIDEVSSPLSFSAMHYTPEMSEQENTSVQTTFEEVTYGGFSIPAPTKVDIKPFIARSVEDINLEDGAEAKQKIIAAYNKEKSNNNLLEQEGTEDTNAAKEDADKLKKFSFIAGVTNLLYYDQKDDGQMVDSLTKSPQVLFTGEKYHILNDSFIAPNDGSTPTNPFEDKNIEISDTNRFDVELHEFTKAKDITSVKLSEDQNSSAKLDFEYDNYFKYEESGDRFYLQKQFKPFSNTNSDAQEFKLEFSAKENVTWKTKDGSGIFGDLNKNSVVITTKVPENDKYLEAYKEVKDLAKDRTLFSVSNIEYMLDTTLTQEIVTNVKDATILIENNPQIVKKYTLVINESTSNDGLYYNNATDGSTISNEKAGHQFYYRHMFLHIPTGESESAPTYLQYAIYFGAKSSKLNSIPNEQLINIPEWSGGISKDQLYTEIAKALNNANAFKVNGERIIDTAVTYSEGINSRVEFHALISPVDTKVDADIYDPDYTVGTSDRHYKLPVKYTKTEASSLLKSVSTFDTEKTFITITSKGIHICMYDTGSFSFPSNVILSITLKKEFRLEDEISEQYFNETISAKLNTSLKVYSQYYDWVGNVTISPFNGYSSKQYNLGDFEYDKTTPSDDEWTGLAYSIVQRGSTKIIPIKVADEPYFIVPLKSKDKQKLREDVLYSCDYSNGSNPDDYIKCIGGIFGANSSRTPQEISGFIMLEPLAKGTNTEPEDKFDFSFNREHRNGIIESDSEGMTLKYIRMVVEKIHSSDGYFDESKTEYGLCMKNQNIDNTRFIGTDSFGNNIWISTYEQYEKDLTPTECTFIPVESMTDYVKDVVFRNHDDPEKGVVVKPAASIVTTGGKNYAHIEITMKGYNSIKNSDSPLYSEYNNYYSICKLNVPTNANANKQYTIYFSKTGKSDSIIYINEWKGNFTRLQIAEEIKKAIDGKSLEEIKTTTVFNLGDRAFLQIEYTNTWAAESKPDNPLEFRTDFVNGKNVRPGCLSNLFYTDNVYFNITDVQTSKADGTDIVSWNENWAEETEDNPVVLERGHSGVIMNEALPIQLCIRTSDTKGENHEHILAETQALSHPYLVRKEEGNSVRIYSKRKRFISKIDCNSIQVFATKHTPRNYYSQNKLTNIYKLDSTGETLNIAPSLPDDIASNSPALIRNEIFNRLSKGETIYSALTNIYNLHIGPEKLSNRLMNWKLFDSKDESLKTVFPGNVDTISDIVETPESQGILLNLNNIDILKNSLYTQSNVRRFTDLSLVEFYVNDSTLLGVAISNNPTGEITDRSYPNTYSAMTMHNYVTVVNTPLNLNTDIGIYSPISSFLTNNDLTEDDTYYSRYLPTTILCSHSGINNKYMILGHNSIREFNPSSYDSIQLSFSVAGLETEYTNTFTKPTKGDVMFVRQIDTRSPEELVTDLALTTFNSAFYYFIYESRPDIILRAIKDTFGESYQKLNSSDREIKLLILQVIHDTIVETLENQQAISEFTANRWYAFQSQEGRGFQEQYVRSRSPILKRSRRDTSIINNTLRNYLSEKDNWTTYIQGYSSLQGTVSDESTASSNVADIFIVQAPPAEIFHDIFDASTKHRTIKFTAVDTIDTLNSSDIYDPLTVKFVDIKFVEDVTGNKRTSNRGAIYYRTKNRKGEDLDNKEITQSYLMRKIRDILRKPMYANYRANMVLLWNSSFPDLGQYDVLLNNAYTEYTTKRIIGKTEEQVTAKTKKGLPDKVSVTKMTDDTIGNDEVWLRIIITNKPID